MQHVSSINRTNHLKTSEKLSPIIRVPVLFSCKKFKSLSTLDFQSVLLVNCYSHPMCADFMCLDLSSDYIPVVYQHYVVLMVPILLYGEWWIENKHILCRIFWTHSIILSILPLNNFTKGLILIVVKQWRSVFAFLGFDNLSLFDKLYIPFKVVLGSLTSLDYCNIGMLWK